MRSLSSSVRAALLLHVFVLCNANKQVARMQPTLPCAHSIRPLTCNSSQSCLPMLNSW